MKDHQAMPSYTRLPGSVQLRGRRDLGHAGATVLAVAVRWGLIRRYRRLYGW